MFIFYGYKINNMHALPGYQMSQWTFVKNH